MKAALIICTYQRPEALVRLLSSVKTQTNIPDSVIIVDGSLDSGTELILENQELPHLDYYRVGKEDRGLTKQRNFGVRKVSKDIDIVFFLDDDTIISPTYFKNILKVYKKFPEALGVSGYITNEVDWKKVSREYKPKDGEFIYDGWVRIEGARFRLRRKFGLAPNVSPGMMPDFSHGYSIGFLPPNGKIYEVELLMGGIASYRKEIFNEISFSSYFEGYGLYEDADFSLRVARKGKLYVNTAAEVKHHHAAEGRPNMYRYGKMVVRNGWYVWRLKNPKPSMKARFKWNATSFLLTLVRLGNSLNTPGRKAALTEGMGRIVGWWSLLFKRPKSIPHREQ